LSHRVAAAAAAITRHPPRPFCLSASSSFFSVEIQIHPSSVIELELISLIEANLNGKQRRDFSLHFKRFRINQSINQLNRPRRLTIKWCEKNRKRTTNNWNEV